MLFKLFKSFFLIGAFTFGGGYVIIPLMKKKNKADRKMTAEQLQALPHMRTRGYVQKNGKTYSRKAKHKGKEQSE